jgi:hypothetical protein
LSSALGAVVGAAALVAGTFAGLAALVGIALVAGAALVGIALVAGAALVGIALVAGTVVVVFAGLAAFTAVFFGASPPQAEIKADDATIAVIVNNLTFIFLSFLNKYLSKSFEKNIPNKFEILAFLKKNASKKQQYFLKRIKNIFQPNLQRDKNKT